ncbi:hypothetical protein M1116_03120 [Patescibacteria group bacterium]|nr:hypothetical protein [Patescibacteria group bacterium]
MAGVRVEIFEIGQQYSESIQARTYEGAHVIGNFSLELFGIRRIIVDDYGTRVYFTDLAEPLKPTSEMTVRNLADPDFLLQISPYRQIIPE